MVVGKVFVWLGLGDMLIMFLLYGYLFSLFDFWVVILYLIGQVWVMMDFLGFGLFDKLCLYWYSLLEQVYLVEMVVVYIVIGVVVVLVYDMGMLVIIELLVCDLDGWLLFDF